MPKRLGAILTSLFLGVLPFAACSSPAEPLNVLVGKWGGEGIEMTATQHDAVISLPCFDAVVNRAIVLAADQTFHVRAPIVSPSWASQDLTLEVWGRLQGASLEVELRYAWIVPPGPPLRFRLSAGKSGQLTDYVCLA